MRCLEFRILASVLSLIFSKLLLAAGSHGVLNDFRLATVSPNALPHQPH
jgi:hypothetical protein